MREIISSLVIGILSGIISGYAVYWFTQRAEKKRETYFYCKKFLFDSLEKCEMHIPVELINYISAIDKNPNSPWQTSTQAIIDMTNPYGHEDTEQSSEQVALFEHVMIALKELDKWKKKNHIR